MGEQQGLTAEAGGRKRGLSAGVSTTDNNNIKFFRCLHTGLTPGAAGAS